jgi:hypothetical protein
MEGPWRDVRIRKSWSTSHLRAPFFPCPVLRAPFSILNALIVPRAAWYTSPMSVLALQGLAEIHSPATVDDGNVRLCDQFSALLLLCRP